MQPSGTAGFTLMFRRPLLLAKNVIHFIRAPIHPHSNVSVSAKLVLVDKQATFYTTMATFYIAMANFYTCLAAY